MVWPFAVNPPQRPMNREIRMDRPLQGFMKSTNQIPRALAAPLALRAVILTREERNADFPVRVVCSKVSGRLLGNHPVL
jgi:hypothetical protein